MKVEPAGRTASGPSYAGALPSVPALIDWQDRAVRAWHRDRAGTESRIEARGWDAGPGSHGLGAAIGRQHLTNIRLWHEEDEARRPDVGDDVIAGVKRRIDSLNQRRNDLIETMDEAMDRILAERPAPPPDGRLHSETPGAIIDRLSILALKLFHMREEAEREDAPEAHRKRCGERLEVLERQRADLAGCLDDLFVELLAGRARFRTYRQFKMYNDPEANPALRAAMRRSPEEGRP